MHTIIDFILNLNEHLFDFVKAYDKLAYLLLFCIIFAETGLVVTPFLPGDALLLTAGIVWAQTGHNPLLLFVILAAAAILGNMVNYAIGRYFGKQILARGWIKQKYLDQTHEFFEKYGMFAVVLARFVPFVRTFVPFVAGASVMSYSKFAGYNLIGAVLWTGIFIAVGYIFGETEFVKTNLHNIEIGVIVVTTAPVIFTAIKQFLSRDKSDTNAE
jgi:membrane-associated protein